MPRKPDLPIDPTVSSLIEQVAEKVVVDLLTTQKQVVLSEDLASRMVSSFRSEASSAKHAAWGKSLPTDDGKLANAIRRRMKELKAAGGLAKLSWGRGRGNGHVKHEDYAEEFTELLKSNTQKQCECFCLQRLTRAAPLRESFKELGNEEIIYPHLGLWLRNDDTCEVTWENRKLVGSLVNGDVSGLSFECDSHTLIEFKDTAEEWEKEMTSCTGYFRYANEVYICFPLCRDIMEQQQEVFGPWRQWELVREMSDLARRVGVGLLVMEYDLIDKNTWDQWSHKLKTVDINTEWARLTTEPLNGSIPSSATNKRWFEAFAFYEIVAAKPNAVATYEIRGYMEQRQWFEQLLAEEQSGGSAGAQILAGLEELHETLEKSFKTLAEKLAETVNQGKNQAPKP